jgi:transcriptional regulator with XRE-family HTH domain
MFAERLREVRERAGVTQYRLAKLSGLTKQTVSRLELGLSQPAWDTVQLLAAALGVDCTAFAEAVTLPESEPGKRGRPRKEPPPAGPRRKRKE